MTNETKSIIGKESPKDRYNVPDLTPLIDKYLKEHPDEEKKEEETPASNQTFIETEDFKEAFFLGGEFGKKIHEKIIKKYSGIEAITKVTYDENEKIVKGSNPFYVVAVNEVLREEGNKIRAATQADLERILRENLLELKNIYEDSGLVLGTRQEPNLYLADDLFNQFKIQGKTLKENSAYVLWLHNLSLKKDANYPNGLSFTIPNNFSDYFEAPALNEYSQQKFESAEINTKIGLPKKISDKGSRTLYTRNWNGYQIKNSGLVRLCLDRDLDLRSNILNLAVSDGDGRVVLCLPEAEK